MSWMELHLIRQTELTKALDDNMITEECAELLDALDNGLQKLLISEGECSILIPTFLRVSNN